MPVVYSTKLVQRLSTKHYIACFATNSVLKYSIVKRPAPASGLLYPTNLIAGHQPAAELGRVGVLPPAPELRSPQPQLRLLSDTTWLTFQ